MTDTAYKKAKNDWMILLLGTKTTLRLSLS